ncbi:MAG: AsmA family protein, partial [Muribaculaceae bacterium]|nr:AsmA family protein [Muribaculaceae bacterium]
MSILRPVYRVARSIIITLILLAVVVYGGLYVLLSIPSFQQKVKKTVCEETSALLGGEVEMEDLTIQPFSEVILKGVSLTSPEGEKCIWIGKVAAGIDLWTLLSDKKIVLNYAEIVGLYIDVEQKTDKGPLNIQFLIDALSPKRKAKPTTLFDLNFRNVVVRDSKAHFLRSW